MTQTRLLIKNACYHIFNRGNHQDNIFINHEDFEFYRLQLKYYKRKFKFLLYAYCLMPNHIHLVGEPLDPEKLPKFMQGLQRSYTAYFNNKYKKVGHLWQGRFKTRIITKDQYLAECISYVEQNPVKANLVNKMEDYKYSSYEERVLAIEKKPDCVDQILIN